jgi:glutamine synthetase adenylyltransferase
MRQITTMIAEGILSEEDGNVLMQAYQHYRALGHRYALAQQSVDHIDLTQVQPYRAQVIALWERTFA